MDHLTSGFKIISKTPLEELQAEGVFARHCVTGLEVYHIHNDDTENLFAFAFMTPPQNSSGVAHILEHSVLCGSKNYPLKDPFLVLSKQSVKTFLNAMTFPDKTVYPASSILEKDYFNLMSVYGDAVFFPLLKKETFEQEGHRLEIDGQGRPYFSGVVLNEMRGAYADFDSGVDRESLYSLLQGSIYAHDSGGFPPDIAELSYEDFCAFHKRYYHPVNCKVFLYGNIDTEIQLAFLHDRFLRFFEPAEKPPLIPVITPYTAPRYVSVTAPAGEGKNPDKLTMTMNWLLPESADIDRLMDVLFLEEVLLGHDGAPLQKRLLDCPFAEDVYPYNGGQTSLKNSCFTLGLADMEMQAEARFEPFITAALTDIVQEGLDPQLIETALNSIDFYNREIIRAGGPFSLILMKRALRGWIHGYHPEASLRYVPAFARLKERIAAAPHYTEDLIRRFLLENTHRSCVSVHPDPLFCEKIDAALAEKAQAAAERLTAAEKTALAAAAHERKNITETDAETGAADAQRLIPHISKAELPAVEPPIPEALEYVGRVPVIFHEQPTNGITYLDMAIPTDAFSAEEYAYLTLYTAALTAMGTETQRWDTVAAEFAYLTGGFSAVMFAAGKHRAAEPAVFFDNALPAADIVDRDWVLIRAKILSEYLTPAVNRIFSYLDTLSFSDEKRLKDIVIQLKNDFDSIPAYSGHSLAALYAGAAYSGAKRAESIWTGIPQVCFLRELYKNLEHDRAAIGTLVRRLTDIHRKVLGAGMLAKVCGSAADMHAAKQALTPHLQRFGFPNRSTEGFRADGDRAGYFEKPAAFSGFPSAVQVGFAALLLPVDFHERDYGAAIVYAQWLETGSLWEAIRVTGGAYGVSAYPDSTSGLFTLTTYRDPTPLTSLCRIRHAIEKSRTAPLSESELEALITGTYNVALQPRTPAQRSAAAFSRLLNGITHYARARFIEGIISCTKDQLNRVADQLVAAFPESSAAIIASETALRPTAEHADLPPLTVMPPV